MIGDNSKFLEYKSSGLARSIKSKFKLFFKNIKTFEILFDENLLIQPFF